ncbi:MAG: cellulose biosynthesis cyclic di-GMP-binding regulatory protein BcsB [Betaproteobacteria bacterium]|nr:cellulose biosynthesis cyclic di-GMP-binding regulatory protein BcsB [Betaproteobacteria bacterium]
MNPRPPTRARSASPRRPLLLPLVAALTLCGGVATGAQAPGHSAVPTAPKPAAVVAPAAAAVPASDASAVSVRADEVVTKATLKIGYSYSPELLSELSKINVLVNGEVAASLALPKEGAGTPVTQIVDLPAHLFTEYNQLTVQLIGHYTTGCEDPLHSSLWATISNASMLELVTDSAPQANDLALLPEPFFDARDGRSLSLPIVFAGAPDNRTLEAAGTLASWFGMRAKGRVLNFPAAIDALPAKGHGLVLLIGASALAGLKAASPAGPMLSVVVNPNDPNGKLLLVQGRDAQELKTAVATLATADKSLSGPSAALTQMPAARARKPYDAPNWLASDRPVKLGELSNPQALNVSGYNPGEIAIPLRLPPDLFSANDKGVPLDLKYRYTPQPASTNSSLTISVNDKLVKSTLLLPMERLSGAPLLAKLQADETLPMQAVARIPVTALRSKALLQLRYMYDYVKQGECRDVIIDNVRGAIDPESTLDISGYAHHMAMPNLAAFGHSGYPFTRWADLSHTAVVLPDAPQVQELSSYLQLMGRLGEATGYPGTAITVARSTQVAEVADKDLLVIATGTGQPLLTRWADALPAALPVERRTGLLDALGRLLGRVGSALPEMLRPAAAATPAFSSSGLSAYAAGFESPLRNGRSVVLFWASEPALLQPGLDALLGEDGEWPRIAGGLATVRGKKVDAIMSEPSYLLSDLDWFTRTRLSLSGNTGMLLLVSAAGAALLAGLALGLLRAQARKRNVA